MIKKYILEDIVKKYLDRQVGVFREFLNDAESIVDLNTFIEYAMSTIPWRMQRVPELYFHGGRLDQSELTVSYVNMDGQTVLQPNLGRVRSVLKAGGTMACYGADCTFLNLHQLKKQFSEYFSAECETHLFYSSLGNQGLSHHYDCVEIFVIQLLGEKSWALPKYRAKNPISGVGFIEVLPEGIDIEEVTLKPGDLLYIPRGQYHCAVTTSQNSLHLTVAVKLPTYLDAIEILFSEISKLDIVRGSINLRNINQEKMLDILTRTVSSPDFIDRLKKHNLSSFTSDGGNKC